ncbi:hypothetical protein OE88DRAFT_1737972 [Heliocybe sulcata]|uniref:Uncharacterized protein n=1 Tax=Heliocybe sulcata TaxID=5364 RepID=A0A5C3MSB6_9AGAM|nr:hypothetical protein OE88DRAFT_1737972 [Heliocybe sulcata]
MVTSGLLHQAVFLVFLLMRVAKDVQCMPISGEPMAVSGTNVSIADEGGVHYPRATAASVVSCSTISSCTTCVANAACGFDKSAFSCSARAATGQVTAATGCGLIQQMQSTFPAAKSNAAGIIPAAIQNLLNGMRQHVFSGDIPTPQKPKPKPFGGRHTVSSWRKAPGQSQAQALAANSATHIVQFSDPSRAGQPKTVWDDGPGLYEEQDINNMCSVVFQKMTPQLSIKVSNSPPTVAGRFVVKDPFNNNVCVQAVLRKSGPSGVTCFPTDPKPSTKQLGTAC